MPHEKEDRIQKEKRIVSFFPVLFISPDFYIGNQLPVSSSIRQYIKKGKQQSKRRNFEAIQQRIGRQIPIHVWIGYSGLHRSPIRAPKP